MAVPLPSGPTRTLATRQASRGRGGTVTLRSEPLGTARLGHGQLRLLSGCGGTAGVFGDCTGARGPVAGTHRGPLCAGASHALYTCHCL